MRSIQHLLLIILLVSATSFGQEPDKLDEFGTPTNDELMTRVNHFAEQLTKTESVGLIKLNGPRWLQYRFIRKIEGCNHWWNRPADAFKFVLGVDGNGLRIEFWSSAKGRVPKNLMPTVLDYHLPQLQMPVELTVSTGTDEYCPIHFDIEWFSKFMTSNPAFKGKVIIDTSQTDFVRRVRSHRKELHDQGIAPSRMRFVRRHFIHERDEQWWLIPPKKQSRQ